MARIARLRPEVRREQILLEALRLSRKGHHLHVTRKDVADALGVSPPLISRYFGTQRALQDEVYYLAIDREIIEVVAQRIPPEGYLSPRLKKKLKKYIASNLLT